MKMTAVKSSNLTHIGHHGTTLHVTYKGGATYRFEPVTAGQHAGIMTAESKGKALLAMGIKGVKI